MSQRRDADGILHLRLLGELDLVTADQLRRRLRQLELAQCRIRLELDALTFIDCTGLRAILSGLSDARRGRWVLEVAPVVSPAVYKCCELSGASGAIWPDRSPACLEVPARQVLTG